MRTQACGRNVLVQENVAVCQRLIETAEVPINQRRVLLHIDLSCVANFEQNLRFTSWH